MLLPHFGWQVIFILGGVFPLVLVAALVVWLPESPRFLMARGNLSPRDAGAAAARSTSRRRRAQTHPLDIARGNPVAMLFGQGYALQTVLMWIIFFCSLMNLFLFAYWMPTVLQPDRLDAGAGGVRLEPARFRRDLRRALSGVR